MKRVLSIAMLLLVIPAALLAAPAAPDSVALRKLLDDFLAGASRNNVAMHDRFWADDLIYTGSSGRRIGKADIMKDMRAEPAPKPGDPTAAYSAEEVRIQQYGTTAVVAFRLVANMTDSTGAPSVAKFLNSGTFLKRGGRWQVVNWQATRIPPPPADAKANGEQK